MKQKQRKIVKYCPACKVEYLEGTEKCADCGSRDLARRLICPACDQGLLPLGDSMDSPCPVCAYLPAIGRQDAAALKNLLNAELNAMEDEDAHFGPAGNPFRALAKDSGLGASPHQLTSAPWFRVLVPARERLFIQMRPYLIAIPIGIAACVLAIVVIGNKELGFLAILILLAIFFGIRNRLLLSGFTAAFDRHYKSLLERNSK